jgi:hypothetical protein
LQNDMCHHAHFEEFAVPFEYLAIKMECIGFPVGAKDNYHVTRLSKELRFIAANIAY